MKLLIHLYVVYRTKSDISVTLDPRSLEGEQKKVNQGKKKKYEKAKQWQNRD